jgi:cation:H+ antiporter
VLSLIITPIATELPEKCNSVLWIGKKKDTLALGNITGAMVFQSSFPVAFGLVGTHWDLCHENNGVTLFSALVTLLCGGMILILARSAHQLANRIMPWLLLGGGAFYAAFLIYLLRQKM